MQYSAIVKDCATMLWYRIQQNIAFGNSDDRWCSSYFNILRDTAACGACLLNNKISTKDIEEWNLTGFCDKDIQDFDYWCWYRWNTIY